MTTNQHQEPSEPDLPEFEDDDHDDGMTDREREEERLYFSGFGDRVGLDPFAYDSSGADTGLRISDFI